MRASRARSPNLREMRHGKRRRRDVAGQLAVERDGDGGARRRAQLELLGQKDHPRVRERDVRRAEPALAAVGEEVLVAAAAHEDGVVVREGVLRDREEDVEDLQRAVAFEVVVLPEEAMGLERRPDFPGLLLDLLAAGDVRVLRAPAPERLVRRVERRRRGLCGARGTRGQGVRRAGTALVSRVTLAAHSPRRRRGGGRKKCGETETDSDETHAPTPSTSHLPRTPRLPLRPCGAQ